MSAGADLAFQAMQVTPYLRMDVARGQPRFDGGWRPLEEKRIWLKVKFGPFVLPVPRTIYRSVHGPVVKNDKGAFAIRYGGIGQLQQLDAYYRLNKAKTFGEWEAQLARLAIPSTNFIYADQTGTIAYIYNAAIPARPESVEADWRGILPGNRSDLIWQGAVDYKTLPRIVNPASGWLYNSNNTPFTAAGAGSDLDPEAFSPTLGIELKQTNRSRRAGRLRPSCSPLSRRSPTGRGRAASASAASSKAATPQRSRRRSTRSSRAACSRGSRPAARPSIRSTPPSIRWRAIIATSSRIISSTAR